MSIWNKVLVGLICAASLALFYVAARTLKIHQNWRELARQCEAKIDVLRKKNRLLLEGDPKGDGQGTPGLRQVQQELDLLLANRGRAWRRCDPNIKVEASKGEAEVSVALDQGDSAGIAPSGKVIVYAFEEADVQDRGTYVGEFQMTLTGERQAKLTPTHTLTPREIERLRRIASAKRPWVLYEEMPHDNHTVFAELTDEQKKAILPADTVAEYLKEGQPAAADDPQDRVADGKYQRALRDYRTLFRIDRTNLVEMTDLFEATTRDRDLVEAAVTDAQTQVEASEKNLAKAKQKLAEYERERDIATGHHDALEKAVAAVKAVVVEMIKTNQAMAGQLAQFQWDAARRIDQRTRAMVQSDARGR